MCSVTEELYQEAYQEAYQESRLNTLCSVVWDNLVDLSVAVKKSGLSEDAFRAEMSKRYPDWQG